MPSQVLKDFSSPEQAESLASQLLRGEASVKTAQLLDNFEVQFKESSVNAPSASNTSVGESIAGYFVTGTHLRAVKQAHAPANAPFRR